MTKDMLGSIGMITDANGAVIGRMHFDPWGKRIDASDWDGAEQSADVTALRSITHRGFTGHEMLDAMNLVHMNGRIYDPNLGRMLSADPINSNPANLQRYNRYSYVLNNPLRFTDPTGLTEEEEEEKKEAEGAEIKCVGKDSCDDKEEDAAQLDRVQTSHSGVNPIGNTISRAHLGGFVVLKQE